MSSINYEPSGFQSAHSPLWYELISANVSQANFKYVFDLYVNSTFVTRQKLFPDPTDNKGYFDVSPIVRSYFDIAVQPFVNDSRDFTVEWGLGEFFVDFHAVVGEEYSGSPFVSGDVTGTSLSAYNWAKKKQLYNQNDLQDYYEKFVSNRPAISTAYFNEPLIIGVWKPDSDAGWFVRQTHYLDTTQTGTLDGNEINSGEVYHADVSPSNYLSDDNANKVVMELFATSNLKDTRTLNLKCHPRYTPVTLLFFNRLGCWDSFTFGLFSEVSIDAEKKMFEQNPYVGRSNTFATNFLRENRKTYAVEYKTKWKLTSDNLTEDEYKWLEELITSPMVYVHMPNAEQTWQPVMVTETNFQTKDELIKKDNILELNIEFSEDNNTQYR